MNKERKHRIKRIIAFYLAINIFFEVASPSVAFALTSGPGQPEMASFEPVGTTEMVDVFSGDFNYNIPLLTVPGPNGGYPINLAYHSTIGMEDEASWVGLGWNINPGAITRQMRGLPDDFNGEFVKKEMNIRPNRTIAASFGFPISTGNLEVWSLQYTPSFNGSVGLMWNNYQGIGLTTGTSSAMKMSQNNGYTATAGLNMNYNSLSGETDVTPSLSLSKKRGNAENTFGLSYTINSLNGIKDVNFNSSRTVTRDYKNINNARAGAYAASTSFASSSFVPHTDLPQSGLSISAYFKLGADAGGAFANCSVHANYDQTELATQSQDFYSYGYLYSNNRQISASNESSATAYSMMDFNREKDVAPNKDLPTMAVPVSTYDIYMVKGQGVGGIFRPYRTDIGVMGDPMITSTHWGGKLGVDVGPGVPLHVGVNAAISFAKSYTGPWKQDFLWKDISSQTHKGEVYFKSAGELVANENDPTLINNAKFPLTKMVYVPGVDDLNSGADDFSPFIEYRVNNGGIIESTDHYTTPRTRSQNMSYKTFSEVGVLNGYKGAWVDRCVYGENTLTNVSYNYPTTNGSQIAEMSVINPDGNRYIYALPAMNYKQKEVSFSIDPAGRFTSIPSNLTDKIINYDLGSNNSINNDQLDDHFFSSTTLPAYVHSYMLTAIVSPDYVDLTGNGPSDDDFGYWVKFNYSRASTNYKWRMPYIGANYMKGNLTTTNDDKAGYTYGEKEIWFVNSIETKTHLAKFTIENRDDAHGAIGENVNYAGTAQVDQTFGKNKLLRKITLISKANPNVVLKEVNFDYDYELCQGTWNNKNFGQSGSNGKLKLKKLWFSYMGNAKGSLSPYEFIYTDTDSGTEENPSYSPMQADRWGNYQPNRYGVSSLIYPYTYQNEDYDGNGTYGDSDDIKKRNAHASAWSLRQIKLPSGGNIMVDYESDDYQYVHDKEAMEMCKVVGFGPTHNSGPFISGTTPNALLTAANQFVYFELDNQNITDADVKAMASGLKDLYFNVFVNLKANALNFDIDREYINGYAEVDLDSPNFAGTSSVSGKVYGYVKVKPVNVKDKIPGIITHPFRKAAWQYMKLERRDLLYPATNNSNYTGNVAWLKQIAGSIIGFFTSNTMMLQGYYNYCFTNGYAANMVTSFNSPTAPEKNYPSFIRLKIPDGSKYGGGHRVKEIKITDTWKETYDATSNPSGEKESIYGQQYSYVLPDGKSSGVAAYEPLLGGEEIPYRKPVRYSSSYFILKNKNLYIEEPIGESYYPGAQVGYSRVVVRNIDQKDEAGNSVTKTKEGITVYEFYTTKDFPFIIDPGDVDRQKHNPKIPIPFIGGISFENVGYSQVMNVTTNDMHGKAKSISTYAAKSDINNPLIHPVSKVEYIYNTTGNYSPSQKNRLNTKVNVLYGDGDCRLADLGLNTESYIDLRESSGISLNVGLAANIEYTPPAIFYFAVMPIIDYAETMFKSVVSMRINSQSGILMETRTTNEGSTVTAKNLMFDAYSGKPLLTTVTNDFDAPIYKYEYAAHWAYDGMDNAYKSDRCRYKFNISAAGEMDPASIVNYKTTNIGFHEGDELLLKILSTGAYKSGWLTKNASGNYQVMKEDGTYYATDASGYEATVLRSGFRNQQSVSNGMVVSLQNPVGLSTNLAILNWWNNKIAQGQNPFVGAGEMSYYDCSTNLNMTNAEPLNSYVTGGETIIWFGHPKPEGGSTCRFDVRFNPTIVPTDYYLHYVSPSIVKGVNKNNGSIIMGSIEGSCTFIPCTTDGVLQASAATFKDQGWTYDYGDFGDPQVAYIVSATSPYSGTPTSIAGLSTTNPYRLGQAGIWRVDKTFAYQTKRKQTSGADIRVTDISKDGTFEDFSPFNWTPGAANASWTKVNEVTKYNPYGFEVENKNAIDIYTSALYGYNNSLQTAITANSSYYETAYDGFEDYGTATSYGSAKHGHIDIVPSSGSLNFASVAHSGKKSLTASASQLLNITAQAMASGNYYFQLLPNKKYTVSAWFKSTSGKPNITVSGAASSDIYSDGLKIEGWQKVDLNFTTDATPNTVTIQFGVNGASSDWYIDDVRIQPFKSTMKTFVYNPLNLWLVAELDNQNYATFYNYDEEGTLTQVKKETVKGVLTLKSSRSNIKRN